MQNFHFWALINENGGNFEFHFFPSSELSTKLFSVCISAGMRFHSKSQTSYMGQNYEFQPVSLEG
jgi:hypothetical protein